MALCVYCGNVTSPGSVICPKCAENEIPSPQSILKPAQNPKLADPSTANFTKPENPAEGKDPSVKQAVELEHQTYQQNKEFAEQHPERVDPNVIGTKAGKQVIREANKPDE